MKTKDAMIGVLVIGIVVLGVLYYNKCNETNPSESVIANKLIDKRKKCYTAEELCNMEEDACGEEFEEKDTTYIRRLIGARRNALNKVYGYQIDLKYIDSLREAIRLFNEAGDDNALKIIGLRFYEAKSTRKIQGKDQYEQDLVMVPFLSNCKDIYLVDDQRFIDYPVKMYTHFRPCPKLCSGEENLYIHQGKGKVK